MLKLYVTSELILLFNWLENIQQKITMWDVFDGSSSQSFIFDLYEFKTKLSDGEYHELSKN